MAPPSDNKVFREYHRDDSFMKRPDNIVNDITEYQLCLAFATDSGDGRFIAGWDRTVTPQLIQQFKDNCAAVHMPVKVFVSIGGNLQVVVPADDWIDNASPTLRQIIHDYNIDGIDVNYTTIEGNHRMFVDCIQHLIEHLREAHHQGAAMFQASLAPNAATNEGFYFPLFQAIDHTWIGTVVFQCYVDFDPYVNNPVALLVQQVQRIREQYNAENTEVLLGYSAIWEDLNLVSPPVFFLALNDLVQLPSRVKGASVKVISDNEAFIPPKWIPRFLSLAVDNAGPRLTYVGR